MPRVTHVKSARKENPVAKVGEPYYWWKFRYGGKRYSVFYPKPWQLTQSEFFITQLLLDDQITNIDKTSYEDVDGILNDIEELRDAQEEKRDNMPEGLQDGPTGELLQERYDACDAWWEALDGANTQIGQLDKTDDDYEDELESALEEITNSLYEG